MKSPSIKSIRRALPHLPEDDDGGGFRARRTSLLPQSPLSSQLMLRRDSTSSVIRSGHRVLSRDAPDGAHALDVLIVGGAAEGRSHRGVRPEERATNISSSTRTRRAGRPWGTSPECDAAHPKMSAVVRPRRPNLCCARGSRLQMYGPPRRG